MSSGDLRECEPVMITMPTLTFVREVLRKLALARAAADAKRETAKSVGG